MSSANFVADTPIRTPRLLTPLPSPTVATDDAPVASTRPARLSHLGRAHLGRAGLILGDAGAAVLAYLVVPTPRAWMVLPVVWLAMMAAVRGYQPRMLMSPSQSFLRVLRAAGALTLVGAAASWAVDLPATPAQLLLLVGATAAGSLAHRAASSAVQRRRQATGRTPAQRLLLVGDPDQVAEAAESLRGPRVHGVQVVGACTAGLGEAADAATAADADAVVVLPGRHDAATMRRLGWELEQTDAHLFVVPGLTDVVAQRTTMTAMSSLPMLHVRRAELGGWRRAAKGTCERGVALLAVLCAAPLLLALMVAIRLESAGSPIFKQVRVGRNGKEFTMLKLRTMQQSAEQTRAELLDANEADAVLFKMRNDPRTTRVGRVLRRYSLDELPQLINVVRGEMSLVGPRPALPHEVADYEHDVRRRLAVKPGLTGLWQVSGRSDLPWEEAVRLDLRYVDNWTPGMDLEIIARTARAVVAHEGAY